LTVLTPLTRREDLAAYNEEYAKFFPTNKPARTTVEAMLNFPELLVEITVAACVPELSKGGSNRPMVPIVPVVQGLTAVQSSKVQKSDSSHSCA
jgi:hypothetical protein